jgi:Xaa-Pro aminopeptidase
MSIDSLVPVLVHGRAVWDLEYLPVDEFEERLKAVRSVMADNGVQAAVIACSSGRYANVSYLTGYRATIRHSVLLVHASRSSVLFAGLGGSRGFDQIRAISWIGDVRHYGDQGEGARAVLTEWGLTGGPIGVAGFKSDVPIGVVSEIMGGLDGFEPRHLDEELFRLRRRKNPRELALLARSSGIVARARQAAATEFIRSASPYKAAIAAELSARVAGVCEFRVLANLAEDGALRPLGATEGSLARHLTMHIGLEASGYWAETTFGFPVSDEGPAALAQQSVDTMAALARPGVRLAQLAEAAAKVLGDDERIRFATSLGLGQGLGLGVEDELEVTTGSTATLLGGEVLSLRTVTAEGTQWFPAAGTVLVTEQGGRPLASR